MGCPPWDIPPSPSGRATPAISSVLGAGLGTDSFLGAKPLFCIASKPRLRTPGLSAQSEMEKVTMYINKYKIITKRKKHS